MNLCHIVPSLEEQHGGPSKSVRLLCRALAQDGDRVELLATAADAPRTGVTENSDPNLRVRIFRRDWPPRLCVSGGLHAAAARTDAAIVHHHSLWLRTLHYAHRAASSRGVPLVLSPRGMMSTWAWHHHRWRKRASRWLVHPGALNAVAGWHVTSREEENDIRALGFRQPVCVAPNGVDAPAPDESAGAAAFWREACPETARRPTALFYGRFHEKKRVIELIDLWIERAAPDWLLLLVGIPEEYTPDLLERYALKLSAPGRVRAFSGLTRPPPYAVASLFLLPSHSENFGLAVAEAMAHGLPALVTDTTPWRALNTENCGWCVAWPDFGPALAAATRCASAELQQRGARARTWVLREFSWRRSAESLHAFYSSLVLR